MGAGMPEPGPGQHQERLGGGRQSSDRRRLRHRLQKLCGALQKARSPRRQVRRKILRNKHPPSSNRCHFIHTFAFVCIHTSYIRFPGCRLILVEVSLIWRKETKFLQMRKRRGGGGGGEGGGGRRGKGRATSLLHPNFPMREGRPNTRSHHA